MSIIDGCIATIKLKKRTKVRMLLIFRSNGDIDGFKTIKYKEGLKNTILIKKNYKIKFDLSVLPTKIYKINKKYIDEEILKVQGEILSKIDNMYCEHKKISSENNNSTNIRIDLHKELHKVKRKIELSKFNNEDYSKLELRLNEILDQLDYDEIIRKNNNYKEFNGHRVAVNKGKIKIYGIN